MLESLGLTTYENDTYTTLLKVGEAEARKISEQSGVPFGRIYDILSLLESKELVIVQPSRPKKYRAIDPKIAVNMLIQRKKEELLDLEKEAERIKKELIKIHQPEEAKDMFWKVGIGDDLIPSYIEVMRQTLDEVLGYLEIHPSVTIDDIELFMQVVGELIKKNVRIKFLIGTNQPEQLLDVIDQYQIILSQVNIRYIEPMSEPFNIIDNEKVVLKVRNPVDPSDDFAFIYVWDENFAMELREIYNKLWRDGTKLTI